MSRKRTSTPSRAKTDWKRFDTLTDAQVRAGIEADPDAQPTDAEFWQQAELMLPKSKEIITIRLDPDVLEWFRRQGRGYQTRINAVLRSYMQAHEGADSPRQ